MQIVKDYFDNEVFIGDAILHWTKKSTEVDVQYSIIYGFIWRGDNTYQAKVVSVRKHYYNDDYIYYRAALTSNNFVRIPMDSIPEDIRLKLLAMIKV
jgi:hypothetical protein